MKKTNIKTNKRKLVARVMLLVLLLTSAMNFVGCDRKMKYVYFASDNISGADSYLIKSSLSTTSNEHYNNDVEFKLSFGIHELNFWGIAAKNPKEQIASIYQDGTFTLNVNLCNSLEDGSFNEKTIKTITDEELFSRKYGYIDTPVCINNGITYMNSETIIVPKEFFELNYGQILIELELILTESSGKVYSPIIYTFTIKYRNIDGNIILNGGFFINDYTI